MSLLLISRRAFLKASLIFRLAMSKSLIPCIFIAAYGLFSSGGMLYCPGFPEESIFPGIPSSGTQAYLIKPVTATSSAPFS
jgi:hypothetical protein